MLLQFEQFTVDIVDVGVQCVRVCLLYIFHVGSLPTAHLVFLCGSPLPVVLPPWLKAKTISVVERTYCQGFE